jgi:pimeloyl-ACP methyl ester carboxylesterase
MLMPLLTVEGDKVYYAHRRPVPSRKPSVVFVHGAGGTHQHWLYQMRDLPDAPTYALDLPGHGRSEGLGQDSIEDYGDWLIRFLDAAELDRAILVGHSMGGAIALDVTLRWPERVVGIGLVATGARLRVAPAILEGILQDAEAAVRLICEWAFGPEASQEVVRLGRRQMAEVQADVLHGDFVACNAFDLMGRLEAITAPALVLCGTQDRLTPIKFSVYLRDHIPGATLRLVEGAGHMVMVERPGAVVQALVDFLETL